jgi:hypothetical protein
MKLYLTLFVTSLVVLAQGLATTAAAKVIEKDDFAYGHDVFDFDSAVPVQTALVPVELYRGVTRKDLGDVRVFNNDGEEVPHAIRSLWRTQEQENKTVKLPFFPLYAASGGETGDLSLRFERNDNGTIVSLKSDGAAAPGRTLSAYLIDASGETQRLRRLVLGWAAGNDGFVVRVRVESSDDLANWTLVVPDASVARLDFAGHALERRYVHLGAVQAKYLRLSWQSEGNGDGEPDEPPFTLSQIEAEAIGATMPPERMSAELTAAEPATPVDGGTAFDFDLGGPVPVDHIALELPQENTLANVTLQSRATAADAWITRHRGLAYRVRVDGQELVSDAVPVDPSADRFWRVVVDAKGGGLGKGVPRMQASWLPQQLLFVARGKGPYLVAYGSYKAEPSTFDAQSLLALVPDQRVETLAADNAKLAFRRTLSGDKALIAPPPPPPWKVYILWTVLVLGVLLLAFMAWRVVKQLGATSAPPPADSSGSGQSS